MPKILGKLKNLIKQGMNPNAKLPKLPKFISQGVNPVRPKLKNLPSGLAKAAGIATTLAGPGKFVKAIAGAPFIYAGVKGFAESGQFRLPTTKEQVYGTALGIAPKPAAAGIITGELFKAGKDAFDFVAPYVEQGIDAASEAAIKAYLQPAPYGSTFTFERDRQAVLAEARARKLMEESFSATTEFGGNVIEFVNNIPDIILPEPKVQVDVAASGGLSPSLAALVAAALGVGGAVGYAAARKRKRKKKRSKKSKKRRN